MQDMQFAKDALTFTPIAIAIFSLTISPNLKDPLRLSLMKISSAFLDKAKSKYTILIHKYYD
jgi:hypothetical protein